MYNWRVLSHSVAVMSKPSLDVIDIKALKTDILEKSSNPVSNEIKSLKYNFQPLPALAEWRSLQSGNPAKSRLKVQKEML